MPRRAAKQRNPIRQTHVVLQALETIYPSVRCGLTFAGPYQLLVATILSAQCTDARVNIVTPALFARFPDPAALAQAEEAELETLIHSAGFFRAKAKNLKAMAQQLVALHGGEVPPDLDSLVALAGVGRKTANVVLGNAFGIASGVVVDTHVKRLSYRLGLTERTDPVQIERDLIAHLPQSTWVDFSHRLIEHGRKVCIAQRPRCPSCELLDICPRNGLLALKGTESTESR